jgi:tripartite-type tricarboxylate transporter receptor subunit TctC
MQWRGAGVLRAAGFMTLYREVQVHTAASEWRPQREIEIVAGTPPGGGLDRAARARSPQRSKNASSSKFRCAF